MNNENTITKQQIIGALAKSPHGNLTEYVPICSEAARREPEFLSHLISWSHLNSQIRDSKVALPVISLSVSSFSDPEFVENSLAHMALLDVRNFVKAFRFAKFLSGIESVTVAGGGQNIVNFPGGAVVGKMPTVLDIAKRLGPPRPGHMMAIRRLAKRYLQAREANWGWWERTAVQHRKSLRELYALAHVKPSTMADAILFKGEKPHGTVFEAIAQLKNMSALEAAGTILERKIPFLIAKGALGGRIKTEPDIVLALINRMSPSELVNNSTELEKWGILTVPALRAAYEAAINRAGTSKKNTLKATKAAESVEDEGLREKLKGLQEKQIKAIGGVDGNWCILADKSGSMSEAIEAARHIAATLAKFVKNSVHLIFFDTSPRYIDATGKTYDDLLKETRRISADGGTSIGVGLRYAMDADLEVDGIAIVSDGGENNAPYFAGMYKQFAKKADKEPPVYFYRVKGYNNGFLERSLKDAEIEFQEFDLRSGVDYFSLPNLVATMRVNRYSLADAIMGVPLLTLDSVLAPAKEMAHA